MPTDEEIDAMVDDLRFIEGPLLDKAADMLLALKARAEAAEKQRDELKAKLQAQDDYIAGCLA